MVTLFAGEIAALLGQHRFVSQAEAMSKVVLREQKKQENSFSSIVIPKTETTPKWREDIETQARTRDNLINGFAKARRMQANPTTNPTVSPQTTTTTTDFERFFEVDNMPSTRIFGRITSWTNNVPTIVKTRKNTLYHRVLPPEVIQAHMYMFLTERKKLHFVEQCGEFQKCEVDIHWNPKLWESKIVPQLTSVISDLYRQIKS